LQWINFSMIQLFIYLNGINVKIVSIYPKMPLKQGTSLMGLGHGLTLEKQMYLSNLKIELCGYPNKSNDGVNCRKITRNEGIIYNLHQILYHYFAKNEFAFTLVPFNKECSLALV
jgi:hypothetical protein